MPVLASHDTNIIINSTTAFVSSGWLKWYQIWLSVIWHLALASASCDANGIVSSTIVFIRSRWLEHCATSLIGHLMPLALPSVLHYANSITNGNTAFLMLRQLKWSTTGPLFVMWCQWHQCWHHMIPLALMLVSCDATALVSASCDVENPINGTTGFLRSRWSKWCATWLSCHVTPLKPALAPYNVDSVVNGTIAFLRLTIKMRCNMIFWWSNAIGTAISAK